MRYPSLSPTDTHEPFWLKDAYSNSGGVLGGENGVLIVVDVPICYISNFYSCANDAVGLNLLSYLDF